MVEQESTTDDADPQPVMTYEAYLDERKAKLSLGEKQGLALDKSLLTLSAGALGLTLTFLHDHGPITVARGWVYLGITLTVICLLAVLLSLAISQRSISDHIDALDAWCSANFCPGHPSERIVRHSHLVIATLWLNRVAIGSFIIGLGAISCFVIGNI